MTSFTLVQMRGMFKDIAVLRADADIEEVRKEFRAWPAMMLLDILRLRLRKGEEIEVRVPRRLRHRERIDLYEIKDCDGLRQRWERLNRI